MFTQVMFTTNRRSEMTELNWGKINVDNSRVKTANNNGRGGNGQKQLKYVTLGKKAIGKEYILRPIKNPVGFYKAVIQTPDGRWNNVVVEMDEEGGDTIARNHPLVVNHNVPFNARYAVNVIDREDGELKILEGGVSIFEEFSKYKQITEESPGGRSGADFKLEVTGKKGKDYYKIKMHKKTQLSEDEILSLKEEGLFELGNLYKPTAEEKWKELVAKLDTEGNSSVASAPKPVAVAATSSLASDGDDLGDDLGDDDTPFI